MAIRDTMFYFFNKKFLLLEGMGFDSITDYAQNVFVNKGLLAFSALLMGFFCGVDHFIAINIFDPSKGVYILFGATFLDVLLGVSVAVAAKKENGTSKFDSYKFGRAWVRFVTQIAFIFLFFQISLVWDMVNNWMVSTLLLAFVLATFWSAFKNAYALGWIQPSTYKMLEKILSVEEVFNSIVRKVFKTSNSKK